MWIRRIRYWLRSGQHEESLRAEMDAHISERADELREEGLGEAEARAKARREFGNIGSKQEESREIWIARLWWDLWQDLRYAVRLLAKSAGFTAVAVLSLALGIGANTAIYSVIHAVMLRLLPVANPRELVSITLDGSHLTNPLWEEIRDSQDALAGVLASSDERFDLADGGESRYANGVWVSGDYFRMLGVTALRGRLLNAGDDQHGCGADGPVAVAAFLPARRAARLDPATVLGEE